MNQEKYIPSEENIRKAENIMTEEQRKGSEIREKYHEQEQPPWEPFEDQHIDENFERIKPSPEQKEEMDQRVAELGDLFEGSDLNWHMDGALNISLMKGEYIGYHKDVDVSVEKDELAKLDAHFQKKGYGFFLSRTEEGTGNKVMTRAGYDRFSKSSPEHRIFAAIDENGKIRRDKSLNFVDVHIVERNEDGQPLGNSGVVIPEKWVQPHPVEFQGKQINLSHPGKVLYYKMHQGRNYDITDVRRLLETGKITEEDIADVENTFEKEFAANIERGHKIFEAIAEKLKPEMSADEIFEIFLQQDKFKETAKKSEGTLRVWSEKVYELKDRSADKMTNMAVDFFGIEKDNNKKREQLKSIRRIFEDKQKIKKIKEELAK